MNGRTSTVLLIYVAAISLVSVIITVYDKIAAKIGGKRISERSLLALAALGGSAAMFITMLAVHHKTRKPKFMAGIPLIFLIEAVIALLLINILYQG